MLTFKPKLSLESPPPPKKKYDIIIFNLLKNDRQLRTLLLIAVNAQAAARLRHGWSEIKFIYFEELNCNHIFMSGYI